MTGVQLILRELFSSPEMADYLAGCALTQHQLRDAIVSAPVPLERKRDMFLLLAEEENTPYFHRQAGRIERVIREMRLKPGAFLYLYLNYFDPPGEYREEGLEPYLAWEHLFERIQEFLGNLDGDERKLTWFEVDKWSPDGAGRLEDEYGYTILDGEVCYFASDTPSYKDWHAFLYQDLNLPVPFHAGDIVTVDCRPFAPVGRAVILEVGDNRDCCCLQALYRNVDGSWNTGAVKHGHILPGRYPSRISPLYRMAAFRGRLPKEEELLEKVRQYLNGSEERGAALGNYIFQLKDWERESGVAEKQILSYMASDK